jgi:hypothetical protein
MAGHGETTDEPADLRRYWFEFEVEPEPPPPAGRIRLDHLPDATRAQRFLQRGVGVTGYDEADCLELICRLLEGEPLPPIARVLPDVDVSTLPVVAGFGMTVWRGIWHPPLNRSGPEPLG